MRGSMPKVSYVYVVLCCVNCQGVKAICSIKAKAVAAKKIVGKSAVNPVIRKWAVDGEVDA